MPSRLRGKLGRYACCSRFARLSACLSVCMGLTDTAMPRRNRAGLNDWVYEKAQKEKEAAAKADTGA